MSAMSTLPDLGRFFFDLRMPPDPDAILRRCRKESPMARVEGGYAVLRYRMMETLGRDRRLLVGPDFRRMVRQSGYEGLTSEHLANTFFAVDGPEHMRRRRHMTGYFNGKKADEHRAVVRGIVHALLDRTNPKATVNLMDRVLNRVPAELYCHWVGASRDDATFIVRIAKELMRIFTFRVDSQRAELTYEEAYAYIEKLLQSRRESPGADMLSDMVREEISGRLDARELLHLAIGWLEASTESSSHVMGLALQCLLEHRDQWDMLVETPELVVPAVQECMRFKSRVNVLWRITQEDIPTDVGTIEAGSSVILSVRSAHRDDSIWPHPDRLDIQRTDPAPPLTFGMGAHRCMGVKHGTMELEETLRVLVERFPRMRLDGPVAGTSVPSHNGVLNLPVVLDP